MGAPQGWQGTAMSRIPVTCIQLAPRAGTSKHILQAKKRLFWEVQRETEHGMLLGGPEILRKKFHTTRKRSTEKMGSEISTPCSTLAHRKCPFGAIIYSLSVKDGILITFEYKSPRSGDFFWWFFRREAGIFFWVFFLP